MAHGHGSFCAGSLQLAVHSHMMAGTQELRCLDGVPMPPARAGDVVDAGCVALTEWANALGSVLGTPARDRSQALTISALPVAK